MSSERLLALGAVLVSGVALTHGFQTSAPAAPAAITFYRDVLPILQAQCQSCHRTHESTDAGLVAPMPLTTYEEVRPWVQAIVRRVRSREMPPWYVSPAMSGRFEGERHLSDREIATIDAWAKSGAPGGPSDDRPPLTSATVTPGWALGEPDVTVTARPTTIADDRTDDLTRHDFGLIPDDLWVQGVEFRARSAAVHHMCAIAVMPPSLPGPDREISLGCAATGAAPHMLPDGSAFLLPKGAVVRFEVHGRKRRGPNTAVRYQSQLGLRLAKGPVKQRVRFNAVVNSTFEVPPARTDWTVGAVRVFDRETTVFALWPHGHLRLTAVTYTAFYPDGRSELLLDIPRYDEAWQEVYRFRTPKRLPAGTRIAVHYRYDNSAGRAARKDFDSAQAVRFGPGALDEMMLAFIEYTDDAPLALSSSTAATAPAPLHDAADRDLWWRGDTRLPSRGDDVIVAFPRFSIDEGTPVDTLAPGQVVTTSVSAAMKLRTTVPLTFGSVIVRPGNITPEFAGLYGLWVKRTADGWRLVLTSEPDVLGDEWNASAVVTEVPLRHELVAAGGRFQAALVDRPSGGQLVLTWGSHRWTADFTVAGTP